MHVGRAKARRCRLRARVRHRYILGPALRNEKGRAEAVTSSGQFIECMRKLGGTDMLITIAAALTAALATPSGADAPPDTVAARCGVVAMWGETFQRMNQNGTSMVDALESAARMAESDPEIAPVLRAIVITAYSNTPRLDTLEIQDTAVAKFREGLHAECLTKFGG